MFIYNVTINVEESIHEDWINWIKSKHLADVLNTGCFTDARILRVLAEDEGATYSIQYYFNEMNDYERYKNEHAPILQKEGHIKFGNKFIAYRTLLQVVD